MIIKNADYELTAVKPEQYPEVILPEIAMLGRSNVGKSSLINAMCNRKGIARVGSTPGKTRQINFYNVNGTMRLVDLPGYGYAKVPKMEKALWGRLAEVYLKSINRIAGTLLLLDIRHKPSVDDMLMKKWLDSSIYPYIIVAVKADKLAKSKINMRVKEMRKELNLNNEMEIIPFSAEKHFGMKELWKVIDLWVDIP